MHDSMNNSLNLFQSSIDINVCLSNCSNNGLCCLKDGKAECLCSDNHYGNQCQYDKRVCSENKCLNNATCIVVLNNNLSNFENISFYCKCEKPYFGKYCEYKIDLCENQTCSYNGNCIELNLSPKCECFSMYDGEYCQYESASLKNIKTAISTASIIAIIILIFLYTFVIIMDLLKYIIFKNAKKKISKVKK